MVRLSRVTSFLGDAQSEPSITEMNPGVNFLWIVTNTPKRGRRPVHTRLPRLFENLLTCPPPRECPWRGASRISSLASRKLYGPPRTWIKVAVSLLPFWLPITVTRVPGVRSALVPLTVFSILV